MLSASGCRRIGLLLEAYAGGELPGEVAEGVQAHLDACPECARLAVQLRAPLEMLRAWPALSAEDAAALAAQRAELLRAFAAHRRAAAARQPRRAAPMAAWQLLRRVTGVARPPAGRILAPVARGCARLALAGLGWLVAGAGDLLGAGAARRLPRTSPAGSLAAKRSTLWSRLGRSALAASARAARACARAGRGVLALG